MGNEATRFKAGSSGNPTGKSKTKLLTDALRAELVQNPQQARNIARKIIGLAEEGDLHAASLIMDRIEGRPSQQIDISTTVQQLPPAEIDRRIAELAARLSVSVPPMIDSGAEDLVPDDDDTRH